VRTIDRMRQEGELETVPVRGRRLILAASVEAYLERTRRQPATARNEAVRPDVSGGRLPIKVIDERRRCRG
jgi:hypothetical protein